MRWFWQRKRQRQAAVETAPVLQHANATTTATVQRAPTTSGRLGQPRQLTGELLLFARDYLQAAGGRVRVEDEDALSATLPDGSLVRYTTTLAKARADEGTTLLVEGSEALAAMLDDIATRSRLTALHLESAADPLALARDRCAVPAKTCGHCLESCNTADTSHMALCEMCPLREDRLALRWRTPGPLTAHIVRHEQPIAVELAYLVAARDHQGRRDEWVRRAIDTTTGEALPVLTEAALVSAQAEDLPIGYERLLAMANNSAERLLGVPLAATGNFLRQRSLDEYRGRLEEVTTTFDHLQHESPETARATKTGRSRALSALSEVYAVDVEAQLESACFITSPHAVVAIRPHKAHGDLLLRVDIGRQYVLPLNCVTCETKIQAGYVCDAGHAVCGRCAAACSHCGVWRCVACGEASLAACANCGQPIEKQPTPDANREAPPADGVFTVQHLEALPPEMWLTAIEWLLARQGIAAESQRIVGELVLWQGQSDAGKLMIAAIRPGRRWALDKIAIRQAVAHLALDQATVTRMVLATDPATAGAQQAAQQLGVQLVDRSALQKLLAELASAHDREHERQLDAMQTRAEAASNARQALLDVIDEVERALTPLKRTRRAGTQASAGAAASRTLAHARTAIERASLAWETLMTDWTTSFGERPARNGSLVMQVENGDYTEMGERASHLQTALLDATTLLAQTPARGETGYTMWRQAIVEECLARCAAWRWRIRAYDPAAWSDFTRAWNAKAAEKAAEATIAAGHATARADKAQAQAQRAG